MGKIVWSSVVLIMTLVSALIFYGIVFSNYGTDEWFKFLSLLCAVTFFLGSGIFISALLAENGRKNL